MTSSRISLVMLALAACSDPSQEEPLAPDASRPDASVHDASAFDSAPRDAQTSDGAIGCPPARDGRSLDQLVRAIVSNMMTSAGAGSNALMVPSAAARDAFADSVVGALSGDLRKACKLPPSYRIVALRDGADDVLVAAELDPSGAPAPKTFWGTYAARSPATGTRAIVLEAPHPLFDTNTAYEARAVFSEARGDWFLMAGAHRCANAESAGCDGTTSACGGSSAPYRVSDTAHATKTPFFAVHLALSTKTDDAFIQLHGNAQACPDALVSDSSGRYSDVSTSARLAAAIEARGPSVGRCGLDYPKAGCNLCGTDNVEARATAGASDACTDKGSMFGRFVHIEQLPSLRQVPDGGAPKGYQPVVDAVKATFAVR
ncbi:hypothetical protein [Pendulispora albinea]|uniref:Uncharacterized protein n=1 Tax=Pendulispora albinea TaxID=2741071 RepID=A0ABZ2LLY2_9BACT